MAGFVMGSILHGLDVQMRDGGVLSARPLSLSHREMLLRCTPSCSAISGGAMWAWRRAA